MNSVYESKAGGALKKKGQAAVRPRDAATLILVRHGKAGPEVLLGKRSSSHDFMPDKYVFPGGRVDPQDSRPPAYRELKAETEAGLRVKTKRSPRAFAMTAIRETFEETGLVVGRSAEMPAKAPPGWQRLYDLDIAPDLHHLHFVGRAITPPYRPKRFDARFFVAEAERVLIDDRPPLDGAELQDLRWVTIADTTALDLPNVTRFMLGEIEHRLTVTADLAPSFLHWRHGKSLTERIKTE